MLQCLFCYCFLSENPLRLFSFRLVWFQDIRTVPLCVTVFCSNLWHSFELKWQWTFLVYILRVWQVVRLIFELCFIHWIRLSSHFGMYKSVTIDRTTFCWRQFLFERIWIQTESIKRVSRLHVPIVDRNRTKVSKLKESDKRKISENP